MVRYWYAVHSGNIVAGGQGATVDDLVTAIKVKIEEKKLFFEIYFIFLCCCWLLFKALEAIEKFFSNRQVRLIFKHLTLDEKHLSFLNIILLRFGQSLDLMLVDNSSNNGGSGQLRSARLRALLAPVVSVADRSTACLDNNDDVTVVGESTTTTCVGESTATTSTSPSTASTSSTSQSLASVLVAIGQVRERNRTSVDDFECILTSFSCDFLGASAL